MRRSEHVSPVSRPRFSEQVCGGGELDIVYVGADKLTCAFSHHQHKLFGPNAWLFARLSVSAGPHLSPAQKLQYAAQIAARLRQGVPIPDDTPSRHVAAKDRLLYLLVVKPRPGSLVTAFCVAPPADCGDGNV